ncbi:recombination protein U [bacterium]|nr:recombination protein U [bacterium]
MNYPSGIKKQNNYLINYKNRGMTLEDDINKSNQYYKENNIAYIYKKPTPIKVTKVEFIGKNKIIKEAFYTEPSTTDYNGIYKGYYIDFEAKETKNKTSFPLANIHLHQLKHLENISNVGGIGFLIVRFTTLNETYILMNSDLKNYLMNSEKKSISHDYFVKHGHIIKEGFRPRINYLNIIDNILEVKNEKKDNKKV